MNPHSTLNFGSLVERIQEDGLDDQIILTLHLSFPSEVDRQCMYQAVYDPVMISLTTPNGHCLLRNIFFFFFCVCADL